MTPLEKYLIVIEYPCIHVFIVRKITLKVKLINHYVNISVTA